MESETRWASEVRPEWSGHTWRSLEALASPELVAQVRLWADAPAGVLYVYSGSISKAYAFAVAVSQRAEETLCRAGGSRDGLLAVGLLDELSMPDDPDPDHTERARQEYPRYSAADTRAGYAYRYCERLAKAGLALLRLPPSGDPDRVLDQVADGRRGWNGPTLVVSVVPPAQVTSVYGRRIGWRLGFTGGGWHPLGRSTDGAAVLDLDRPPA